MKTFILGMIFIIFIQPIIEGIGSLILTALEAAKSKFGIIIHKSNEIMNNENPVEDFTIQGFVQNAEERDNEI